MLVEGDLSWLGGGELTVVCVLDGGLIVEGGGCGLG